MKLTSKLIFKTMLVASISFLHSCKETKKEEKNDQKAYKNVPTFTLCEADWFPHSQTPAPIEEGKESPFSLKSSTNNIFHQWSWQKFLWVTKPEYKIEKLTVKLDGKDVPLYVGETLPLFLNPNKMHQVDSHLGSVTSISGASVVLDDTAQAGSSGILRTNPNYNSKHNQEETVYYSIHISPTMKNVAEKFKNEIINGTLKKDNTETFPVGSLELKVSWVAVDAIPENMRSNYFTTVGAINDGNGNYTNTEVALLGMHVVGVVENHPEFIWATFEHDELAPNYNWKENQASSTTEKLLFAKGTTTGLDGITWDSKSKEPKLKNKNYDLFLYGVPRDSVGNFMTTSQSEPENFTNIESINTCVKENLKDVWKNYFYNGSIWLDTDGLSPKEQAELIVQLKGNISNATPNSKARGSLNCANVTMETYTQTFQSSIKDIKASNLANCFSCHNAEKYIGNTNNFNTSPLYLSHLFDAYLSRAEGKSHEEVEQLKAKHEVIEYMKNKLK